MEKQIESEIVTILHDNSFRPRSLQTKNTIVRKWIFVKYFIFIDNVK